MCSLTVTLLNNALKSPSDFQLLDLELCHSPTHQHTHARAHTHTHTHAHARARTHTHTHTLTACFVPPVAGKELDANRGGGGGRGGALLLGLLVRIPGGLEDP
jgi:hypothetical protein